MLTIGTVLKHRGDQRGFHFVIFDGTSYSVEPFEYLEHLDPDFEIESWFTNLNTAFDEVEKLNKQL